MISGRVDGIDFTMRERSDTYTITVDASSNDGSETVLATGNITDLGSAQALDYRHTLRFIVAVVRTARRRMTCRHRPGPGFRFCPWCGTSMIDPTLPD
ncbi:hypothetical protein [Cellulomonas sp. FA1]|uniref:hypothetical protein n=1 Tax=Cellulomonas sp. FA1 TaxID=1346710 RepID=UPI0006258BCD|nr:hypothetical protein [Cellulomonas sp. FA1]